MSGKRTFDALEGATSDTQMKLKGGSRQMAEVAKRQDIASPCAACKMLRRRCAQDCVFAPHFPASEPLKFANVHKVFGASNVNKLLQEIDAQQRSDAANSLVYEANARIRDPVYGCVGVISSLQRQIEVLQTQVAIAQAKMFYLRINRSSTANLAYGGISQSPPATDTSSTGSPLLSSSSSPSNHLMDPRALEAELLYTMETMLQNQTNLESHQFFSCQPK